MRTIRLADEFRKTIRYHARGQLTNEYDQKMKMDIWITDLGKKDMIVEQD